MYINTNTLTQHSEADIRAMFPNISFPHPFVPPVDYAYIFPAPQNYDASTQRITPAAPVQTSLGHWEERWTVHNIVNSELLAIAEAKRIAAVPRAVSPRQIKQALTRAGLRVAVDAAVAAGDQDLKDWYIESIEFERDNPVVAAMGLALGVTERQLDDLWTLAATL